MKCDIDGCDGDADNVVKFSGDGEQVITGTFCMQHAREHGYCGCCGMYFRGDPFFEEKNLCKACHTDLIADPVDD